MNTPPVPVMLSSIIASTPPVMAGIRVEPNTPPVLRNVAGVQSDVNTPPALRHVARKQSTSPILRNVAGGTLMQTPQRAPVAAGAIAATPPPAPRAGQNSLCRVLRMDSIRELKHLYKLDENIVHVPVCDRGCDPPVVSAVVHGCCPDIIGFLLRHGSAVDGCDLEGFTAIQNLAMGNARHVHRHEPPPSLRNALPQFPHFPGQAVDDPVFLPPVLPPLPAGMDMFMAALPDVQADDQSCAVAIWLLSFGADPLQRDAQGLTAVDHARLSRQTKVEFLLSQWPSRTPVRALRNFLAQGPSKAGGAAGFKELPPDIAGHIFDFVVPRDSSDVWGRAARPDGSA